MPNGALFGININKINQIILLFNKIEKSVLKAKNQFVEWRRNKYMSNFDETRRERKQKMCIKMHVKVLH